MLSKLSRFFERHLSMTDGDSPAQATNFSHKQLAFAALLVEVARADHHFSDDELAHLPCLLKKGFQLTDEQIGELLELARTQSAEATSLQQFTRWIHRECSAGEKLNLLVAMWEVAYIDGELDKYEEYVIRKVADLIYVPHSDFLRAKQKARQRQA